MTMNKFYFLLFPFIALLLFGCGSFENDPKPVETSEEAANVNIGKVIRSGEFEQRVETEQIPQNNCEGKSSFSFSVGRERTLEQSVDLTLQGEVGGEVELAGKPMEVGIAGKIVATIGAAYSQSNSKSITDSGGMEFTIEAGDFPTYIIVWREKWEKGYIEVEYNSEDLQVPYLYLTTARPELVNVEYKDCETGQPLLSSTSQENIQVEITEQPVGLNCLFIDVLLANGDIIKKLDVPADSGFYGGVQARLIRAVDVPIGWIVHKDAVEYTEPLHLEAGVVASFWSPESCRPLNLGTSTSSQQITPFCAFVTKAQMEELKEIQDVGSAIKQAETFAGNRQNDYKEGEIIPANVLVATDLRSSDIEQFGVVPINNQGGWGLFLTIRDLQAPNAGTYWCIQ